MADATFNDLLAELKSVNKSIKDSSGESATGRAKEAEQAAERKVYDDAVLGTLKSIQETLGKNFQTIKGGDRKSGGLIAGMLGGIGSAVGGVFKAIAKIGVGFAVGMGALGAGIAAFLLALGGADALLGILGNGENLRTLVQNFFGAFDEKTALMMGGIIALSITANKLKVGPKKMAKGMAAMGAGIAGFFGGILIADAIAKIGESAKLDGTSIASLISNFTAAFAGTGEEGAAVLVAILGVGALSTLNPASSIKKAKSGAIQIAANMTAMGLGLAGFMGGILIGEGIVAKVKDLSGLDGKAIGTLMSNFVSAFADQGPEGVATLAVLLGAGASAAIFKKTPTTIAGALTGAIQIAANMTAMGLGIAGFMGGILLGDKVAKIGAASGLDGGTIKKLMGNFVTAFSDQGEAGIAVLAGLLGVGAITGILGTIAPGVGAATASAGIFLGMTAMGFGIAGFALGLIGAGFLAKQAEANKIDGKALGKLIGNFVDAFATKEKMAILAGILGVAALTSFNPLAAKGIAAGMTAIGVGLAGFIGGFAAADLLAQGAAFLGIDGKAFGNLLGELGVGIGKFLGGLTGGAMKALENVDADRLSKLGSGIADLGTGILAFAAGSAVGGVSSSIGAVVDSFKSLFGFGKTKGPIEQIADLSRDESINTDRLKDLGLGIFHLGKGLQAFSGADAEKIKSNISAMEGFGRLSNEDKLLVQSMNMNTMSGAMASGVGGAGTINNNDNRTITIQSAPQLTNITGLEFARTDKALAAG